MLNDGLFKGKDICVITPYKEQASMIRQALLHSGKNESLRDRGVQHIKVHTVDSMQGNDWMDARIEVSSFGNGLRRSKTQADFTIFLGIEIVMRMSGMSLSAQFPFWQPVGIGLIADHCRVG